MHVVMSSLGPDMAVSLVAAGSYGRLRKFISKRMLEHRGVVDGDFSTQCESMAAEKEP